MDEKTEIIESNESDVKESVETFIESAEKTVEELKVAVLDKTAEIDDLHNLVLEKEDEFNKIKSSLETRIGELELALQESIKAKDELFSELSTIKEEALLKERLEVLKENDLLRSEEEAQMKQAEKIKKLSDDEFNDYVIELSDIRKKAVISDTESEVKTEDSAELLVETIEKIVGRTSTEEARAHLKRVLDSLQSDSSSVSINDEKAGEIKEVAAASEQEVSVEQLTEAFKLIALRSKKNR